MYKDALVFAKENPKIRETSFTRCRVLFNEIKPLVMELQKDFGTAFKYQQIVNRLTLSPDAAQNKKLQEKLLEMVSVENYLESVATAKELDPKVKVPPRKEIIKNLIALGPEKLQKIATIMGKPGLIIVPDKSFVEMTDAMNANRHYDNQKEAFFEKKHKWSGRPGKVSVCIADMVQYPPIVPGQKPGEQRNDEQLRTCEKYFRDNDMRLISDTQYAAAMQQSLRAYEEAKQKGEADPEKHILDFYGKPQQNSTIFNQENKTSIRQVTLGRFGPGNRGVDFDWASPGNRVSDLRGRGAVQVM